MASVHDIAAYIMKQTGPLTAMKLQKLVYYTQAWSLALLGREAFPERIEAWAHGPVVYELFDKHRGRFVVTDWPHGRPEAVAPDVQAIADRVVRHYGRMRAEELSARTHAEAPWREARASFAPGLRRSPEIGQAALRAFYGAQHDSPFFDEH